MTPPLQAYANDQLINNSSSSNYLNVVTDFIANDIEFVPYIQYSASVYRYLSLKPNTEIRNIDLQRQTKTFASWSWWLRISKTVSRPYIKLEYLF